MYSIKPFPEGRCSRSLPLRYSFDNRGHMTSFKLLLSTQEEQVLDALKIDIYPDGKLAIRNRLLEKTAVVLYTRFYLEYYLVLPILLSISQIFHSCTSQ